MLILLFGKYNFFRGNSTQYCINIKSYSWNDTDFGLHCRVILLSTVHSDSLLWKVDDTFFLLCVSYLSPKMATHSNPYPNMATTDHRPNKASLTVHVLVILTSAFIMILPLSIFNRWYCWLVSSWFNVLNHRSMSGYPLWMRHRSISVEKLGGLNLL